MLFRCFPGHRSLAFESCTSARYGNFENTVALVREEVIGLLNLIKNKTVRHERPCIDPAAGDGAHPAAHTSLAARAECRDDLVDAKTHQKCIDRYPQPARIDPERP